MKLTTLVNLEGMIRMLIFLKFNQMSNQLLLKKSLLFALHYENFKRLIMTHHQTPLRLEAYNMEGSYLNQTQEGKENPLWKCQIYSLKICIISWKR